MQHLQPVKRLQTARNLLHDATHGFQLRLGVVDHPLRQRLPLDKFGRYVQEITLARLRTRLEHMRTIDTPCDPFFRQKAFEIGRITA